MTTAPATTTATTTAADPAVAEAGSTEPGRHGSRRRTVAMVLAPLLVLLVGVGAIAGVSQAATNGWNLHDRDHLSAQSSQGGARVEGTVAYYDSWRHPFSVYGRIERGTKATADRGCAVVTVTWLTVTGGVSAGPVSGSPAAVSRGATAIACNGQSVDLGGIELVSRTAYGVEVQVCWAQSANAVTRYCRSDRSYNNAY